MRKWSQVKASGTCVKGHQPGANDVLEAGCRHSVADDEGDFHGDSLAEQTD